MEYVAQLAEHRTVTATVAGSNPAMLPTNCWKGIGYEGDKMFTVYLVGPITGMTFEEVNENIQWRKCVLEGMGYTVIHPFMGKGYLRTEPGKLKPSGFTQPASTDHAIFHRDRWMVEQADILLADLTPGKDKVSIGSMFELAWASLLRKNVVVVLPEENVHVHAFVKEAATVLFPTLDDAFEYLQKLASD